MPTFKLTLAYDGSRFSGWQLQPDRRTVQGELEAALAKITQTPIRVTGSSRTDAGVHALGQVVSFAADTAIAPEKLMRGLNHELPEDVVVRELAVAPDGFHAIRNTVRKRYRYVIHDGHTPDLLRRLYSWHCGHPLDAEAMHRAAQGLLGKHDFCSFESQGSVRESSVRTVLDLRVTRESAPADDLWSVPSGPSGIGQSRAGQGGPRNAVEPSAVPLPFVRIEIEADGFLYNMVRAIAGTLYDVGRGARPEHWPREVLEAQDRSRAGRTAPPQGLFLLWIEHACGAGVPPAESPDGVDAGENSADPAGGDS
jgi:tRNA pseudouridine38-40 synthase